MTVTYKRSRLVEVVIYHQRRDDSGCHCGWGDRPEHLGTSWAEHIADVYEDNPTKPSPTTQDPDPCPTCNGDGESDESPLLPCPDCWGSGVVTAADTDTTCECGHEPGDHAQDGCARYGCDCRVPAADTATQDHEP